MDTLKKYIDQHHDEFEEISLPAGHEMRFAHKLNAVQKKRFKLNVSTLLKVAAISILTLLSSLYVFENLIQDKNQPLLSLSEIDKDYTDIEFYFTSTTNKQMEFIENTLNDESPVKKAFFMKELASLDTLQNQLQHELNSNPNDERVVNAILQYYQFKMEVLAHIIDQLKQVKNLKTQKHDTIYL